MTDPISAAAAASTKTATDAGLTVTGSTGTVTKELAPPPQDTAKNPAESEDDDDDETTSEPEIGAVATATATATVTTTAITNTDTDAADSNSKTGTTNASTTRPSTATTASPHNPAFSKELHAMCTNYNMNQRRAIQSAILLEAHRALIDHHPHKPSHTEHKQDFLSTASIILDTMDWIPQESKAEILVRTMTKKLPLTPELAYKRFKENLHYLSKTLIPKIMEFGYDFDISHEENCDAYLQHTFAEKFNTKTKFTEEWMYKIDNQFLTYRIFYRGDRWDPKLTMNRYPLSGPVNGNGNVNVKSKSKHANANTTTGKNTNIRMAPPHTKADRERDAQLALEGQRAMNARRYAFEAHVQAQAHAHAHVRADHLARHSMTMPYQRRSMVPTGTPVPVGVGTGVGARSPASPHVPVTEPVRPRNAQGNSNSNSNNNDNRDTDTDNEPSQVEIDALIGDNVAEGRRRRKRQREDDNDNVDLLESKKRRELISEISDHLDVLDKFGDAVSVELLNERRKALFRVLPMPK